MGFEIRVHQKQADIASLGRGLTDWTIPTDTERVHIFYNTPVDSEIPATHDFSFRDSGGTIIGAYIGQITARGSYSFFSINVPSNAAFLRVEEDNGSAAIATFYQTVNFIVKV